MPTKSRFDKEEYKKSIENYLIWDGSLKNWENARDDPEIRQRAGLEDPYHDRLAYAGTPTDQFKGFVIKLRNRSTSRFANQTRENLDTILNNISSKIEPEAIITIMSRMPVYDKPSKYLSDSAETHKEVKEATQAYESDNTELMKAYILSIVDEELRPAVDYHAANNPHFKEIFQRGILTKKVSDFAKTFAKDIKGKKEIQWDKEKIQAYLKFILQKTEDNAELAKYFIPLARIYQIEK